jgi:2-polyprenyl-3-methyl-5-hydroxy-6-metoxy-1,4-benzoquinol methylase
MDNLKLKSNWKETGKTYQSINYDGIIVSGARNINATYDRLKKIGFYKKLKQNHSVLDIGCNLGALCLEASKIGCKNVVGIDKPSIIDDANLIKEKTKANVIYHGINIAECNLSELFNIVSGSFDHVFAMAVMMYIPQIRFWKIINHYAKKTLWFETNHRPNEKKIKKIFNKMIPTHKIQGRWKTEEIDVKGKHFRIIYRLEKK